MAAAKSPGKKSPKDSNQKGFEEALWGSANKLRGSVESSEYSHVVHTVEKNNATTPTNW